MSNESRVVLALRMMMIVLLTVGGASGAGLKRDVTKFEPYTNDGHYVWYCGAIILGADPKTFQSMAPYGKDRQAVYLGPDRLVGADPRTFVVLPIVPDAAGPCYAKDDHAVYYRERPIPGADPATFTAPSAKDPDAFDAKDKNHGYSSGEVVNQ